MEKKLIHIEFECKYDSQEDLIVGYASKEVVDLENDLVPAEVWFEALDTFFQEGMPVKLLHRPSLTVAETVWLKIVPDGLILASRPLYPEIKGLIQRRLLKGYSIGYYPLEVEEREDGVRVLKRLKLYEISLVDIAANQECYFSEVKNMLRPNIEVHFDPQSGVVTAKGLTSEEMAKLAELLGQSLEGAGVKDISSVRAIEFKMAEPEGETEEKEEKAPKWVLYRPGYNHARELISQGKISTDPWDAPDFEDFDNDIETWRLFHLAHDPDGDRDNAGTYAYPYGKNGKVYYNALRAARQRASQFGLKDIYEAAGRLLELAREKLGKDADEDEGALEKVLGALKELVAKLGPGVVPKEENVNENEVKKAEAVEQAPEAVEEKAPETAGLEEKLAELEGLKSLPEKLSLQEKSLNELSEKVDRLEGVLNKVIEALAALSPKAASIPTIDTRSEEEKEDKGWGLGLDSWAKKFAR